MRPPGGYLVGNQGGRRELLDIFAERGGRADILAEVSAAPAGQNDYVSYGSIDDDLSRVVVIF